MDASVFCIGATDTSVILSLGAHLFRLRPSSHRWISPNLSRLLPHRIPFTPLFLFKKIHFLLCQGEAFGKVEGHSFVALRWTSMPFYIHDCKRHISRCSTQCPVLCECEKRVTRAFELMAALQLRKDCAGLIKVKQQRGNGSSCDGMPLRNELAL